LVRRQTSETRQVVDGVGAERLMKLIRRNRLVLASPDPRIHDVTVTALLKALQQAAEAAKKSALRLTGCGWRSRWRSRRDLRAGSTPSEQISKAASDCTCAEQSR
jgi:hypothetical protein